MNYTMDGKEKKRYEGEKKKRRRAFDLAPATVLVASYDLSDMAEKKRKKGRKQ